MNLMHHHHDHSHRHSGALAFNLRCQPMSFKDLLAVRLTSADPVDSSPASSSSISVWSFASDSSDSSEGEVRGEGSAQPHELRQRRVAQTEKARAAALLARQKRKNPDSIAKHPAYQFKPDLQPRPEINKPGTFTRTLHRRRLRVVFSWF